MSLLRLLSHQHAEMADGSHITWRLRSFSLESIQPHFYLIFVFVNLLCGLLWHNASSSDLQLFAYFSFTNFTLPATLSALNGKGGNDLAHLSVGGRRSSPSLFSSFQSSWSWNCSQMVVGRNRRGCSSAYKSSLSASLPSASFSDFTHEYH